MVSMCPLYTLRISHGFCNFRLSKMVFSWVVPSEVGEIRPNLDPDQKRDGSFVHPELRSHVGRWDLDLKASNMCHGMGCRPSLPALRKSTRAATVRVHSMHSARFFLHYRRDIHVLMHSAHLFWLCL